MSRARPFSIGWTAAAIVLFTVLETVFGRIVSRLLTGFWASARLPASTVTLIHIASFLVGGFLIGAATRSIRITEPVVAAFVSVAATLAWSLFSPLAVFDSFAANLLAGGTVAALMALIGGILGDRARGSSRGS